MVTCSQLYYKEQILLKYTILQQDSVNENFIAAVKGMYLQYREQRKLNPGGHCDFAHITTALGLNFIIHKTKGVNRSQTSKIPPVKISSPEIYIERLLLETPFPSTLISGTMDKVGDDHWLPWGTWPFKPKTKIHFLKLYHFPLFSLTFSSLGQWLVPQSLWNQPQSISSIDLQFYDEK